jgi:hypothetical protein
VTPNPQEKENSRKREFFIENLLVRNPPNSEAKENMTRKIKP